jgi:hypothetical protein
MMQELEAEEARPRGSIEFVETSVLDTIVPFANPLNIEEALGGSVERLDDGRASPLASIPQRQALFFGWFSHITAKALCLTYSQILDETVNVYVVLQTPYSDEGTLRSYLGRLVINLEAQVVNSQPENHEGPPGQETIYSGSVQDGEDPLIIVQGPDEADKNSGEGHILVVWKLAAFLVRPRLRLQNPSVLFAATANLKPAEHIHDAILKEEYLPSQVPSGMNLLEVWDFYTRVLISSLQSNSLQNYL